MPPILTGQLQLERCPHCNTARPTLSEVSTHETHGALSRSMVWKVYECSTCGCLVTACSGQVGFPVTDYFPSNESDLDEAIPSNARSYLKQATESTHAPAGAIMLCASSVDAMLKEKGYTDGSLFRRIDEASRNHDITESMAEWAHQVRLDANEQRHADVEAGLPTREEANQSIEFTKALAQFLFVLPARIARGIEETSSTSEQNADTGSNTT